MKDFLRKIKYQYINRGLSGWTAPIRVLPDLLVIGVVRSGTTSLFHYLNQHPCISKSAYDEIGYFDDNYKLGINWYRSMFPTKFHKNKIIKKYGKFVTYDVTPFYIYNQKVSLRIKQDLVHPKILAILRNPIDRAYSNYFLNTQNKKFEERIDEELKILEKINKKEVEEYYKFVHESLIARGFYIEQIQTWYDLFSKDNIKIIKSEELNQNTRDTMNEIFEFLGLDQFDITDISKKNKMNYSPMLPETRKFLMEYFEPYNQKLYSFLNKDFKWN